MQHLPMEVPQALPPKSWRAPPWWCSSMVDAQCWCRALGSCIIWQLKLSDIQPLLNVYPELMQNMVASLEKRLMARAHFNPEDAER